MLWRDVAEFRPDIVYADHLREFKDENTNEVKRQGNIAVACKDIAKTFDAAFVLAAQLSRKLESREDKRPIASDLRDSGEIEEVADFIGMLYRDSYYNPIANPPKYDPTELWVRKFRDGPAGILINLLYDAAGMEFVPAQAATV
jgi:replicative DNA helicase